ncbi:hypothetical protein V8F33_006456 [Rhypophila sp. PSN 637]
MHKTSIAILALGLLSSLVSSLILPQNLTDGTYFISVDDTGNEVLVPVPVSLRLRGPSIAPPPSRPSLDDARAPSSSLSRLVRRAVSWPWDMKIHCKDNIFVNHNELYNGAYGELWNTCWELRNLELDYPGLTEVYGNTMAFYCTYRKNKCKVEEFGDSVARIGGTCKKYRDAYSVQAGYLTAPAWKKSYGFTDLRTIASGKNVCASGAN